MKFLLDFYNVLLHRHDIAFRKSYSSNPGYSVVREDIAKHFGKGVDCVSLKSVKGSFGSSEFFVEAKVYDSPENLLAVEPKPRVKAEVGK